MTVSLGLESDQDSAVKPVISILIPAYESGIGVKIILDKVFLAIGKGLSIECIVSDDSRSDIVKDVVVHHAISKLCSFRYFRNGRSSGAVNNWNMLLSKSRGSFVWFLHHDEFPYDDDAFQLILTKVGNGANVDFLILDCFVKTKFFPVFRAHVPKVFKKIYLNFGPHWLFARNVIGSPSNVVVRKEICNIFDNNLNWLVDVEWYYGIISKSGVVVGYHSSKIISVNNSNSITQGISDVVNELKKKEIGIIDAKYQTSDSSGFVNLENRPSFYLEKLLWFCIRTLVTPFSILFGVYIPEDHSS